MIQKQIKTLFSGTVQGVGFRYTVQNLAGRYDVTGYVRNLPDGRVELVAEGGQRDLQSLLDAVCRSHLSAFIRGKQVVWSEPEGCFERFQIAV